MARLRMARTAILLLLFLCGTAGYLFHAIIFRYTITHPPSQTGHRHPRPPNQGTQWSWPPPGESPFYQLSRENREADRLVFVDDGLVRNWEDSKEETAGYARRSSRVRYGHPIYRLIEEGQVKWATILKR